MKKLKRVIISLAVVGAVGAGGFFGWRYLRQNNVQPVKVFDFDNVGMTQYWGDTKESYGPVSTDKIQTIYLSDTQTVSEILVEEGQTVKKGDLLMSFDTSLSQLELERKDLEIQKLEMDLEEANKEAQKISWMVPMGVPPTEPETQPTVPATVMFRNGDYSLFREKGHDGSSPGTAMICWVPLGKEISTEFLQEQIGELIQEEAPTEPDTQPTDPSAPTDPSEPTGEPTAPTEPAPTAPAEEPTVPSISGDEELIPFTAFLTEEETTEATEAVTQAEETTEATGEATVSNEETTAPTEETTAPTEQASTPSEETTTPTEEATVPPEEKYGTVTCTDAVNIRSGPGTDFPVVDTAVNGQRVTIYETVDVDGTDWGRIGEDRWICLTYVVLDGAPTEPTQPSESTEPTQPTEPSEPTEPTQPTEPTEPTEGGKEKRCRPYYVVFKVTENNYLRGNLLVWLGVHVNADGSFSFFDARNVEDISLPEEQPEETEPDMDWIGSGVTYTEIQKMKEENARKIKDLEIQLKLAESELKIMERELSDGNIYAEQDGKVISLLTEEDAKLNSQPIMKVSGGGGYYVEASISELERDTVELGMEVTVNDWETGNTYTGSVVYVGDIPSSSSSRNGMSNPNASSYPFRVFVDESADLKAGSYVSVQYSSAAEGGIYLENPFLRTVQGRSFVYVLGEDGTLEERTVTIGKSLGGSYTQILDGLTTEDLIAFPYGKNVKPGVPAEKGDLSDLYN